MAVQKIERIPRAAAINLVVDAMRHGRTGRFLPEGTRHKVDSAVYRAVGRGELPKSKHYIREDFLRWAVTTWPEIQDTFPDVKPLPHVVEGHMIITIGATLKVVAVTIPADDALLRKRYVDLRIRHEEEVNQLQRIISDQKPIVTAY